MKLKLMLLPVLFLAACATPEERCARAAWEDYNEVYALYKKAQRNVARGYAVHTQTRERNFKSVCYDKEGKPYECIETEYETVETPVAIDVREERRKAAEYKARFPRLRQRAQDREARCLAQL